ncbi:MAG: zinc-ribbon domain-containing protein, partial [Clostridium sp.]|nr:zinc-ribbon domain-containing protein [Clostridium sp.]
SDNNDTMICSNCGRAINCSFKYCPHCGEKLYF